MLIRFDKEYLSELYNEGRCSDKKHRYQPQIIKSYIDRIRILAKVDCIEDLFPFNSLNYEALSGDKKGMSSIRINKQYRLEFIVSKEKGSDEIIINICTITDISNHYK